MQPLPLENITPELNRDLAQACLEGTDEMVSLLREMVLIQSGSHNKPGVDQVAGFISQTLAPLGLELTRHPCPDHGDILLAETTAAGDRDNILLVGHMDTVFPKGTDFNWFKQDEENCYGPGVVDMKGGLVIGIFALKLLSQKGLLADIPLRFIFNPDEEIGSPVSRGLISREAKRAALALVLECGGTKGEVVTGRKGKFGFKLEVKGQAGHAAYAEAAKPSAILELARQIIVLEGLNNRMPGLTVNVGQIEGGIGPNTIAPNAKALVDVRFSTPKEQDFFHSSLKEATETGLIPGTSVQTEPTSQRPAMDQSQGNLKLYQVLAQVAALLGQELDHEFRQGVSDANLIAAQGTPVVDGLGPLGGKDHSDQEFLVTKSLAPRAALFTLSLLECSRLCQTGVFTSPLRRAAL